MSDPARAATRAVMDGNEAVARIAHRLSEVVAIYPITPASTMGELADAWSAEGRTNLWGDVPEVVEMQSEAGAAGVVHGALQAGALATTFTASQGLLLMVPNLYKIAGELTPCVIHIAARTVAAHALSIFGDHSDLMACRQTGWAILVAGSVQEAHDLAAVAHAATLATRIPFLAAQDGFRTSHEVATLAPLADDDLRALVPAEAIAAHRARSLSPERPVLRGTAQNPDAYFQGREACNPFYDAAADAVAAVMDRLGARTGRRLAPFEYVGHPEAERVVVVMGSAGEAAEAAVRHLARGGARVGAVRVRLYRPFDGARLVAALPATTRAVAVLDRTKEPGAPGEPLFLDVLAALARARAEGLTRLDPVVVGGRYGLASKELTPAMIAAALEALARPRPPHGFTLGIEDDVTRRSLPVDPGLRLEDDLGPGGLAAVFYGLGADGTVGSNKATAKLLGEDAGRHVQAYFVYDSKKSGSTTVSHLRVSAGPIRAPWLVERAGFVGVHQWKFVEALDVLERAAPGATVLLNAPYPAAEVWDRLPRDVQARALELGLTLWAVDAEAVAREAGLPRRVGVVLQAAFLLLSGALPEAEVLPRLEGSLEATYGKKGLEVVRRNVAAIRATAARLARVPAPGRVTAARDRAPVVAAAAPDFVRRVSALLLAGQGDRLPVSAFPPDGTWPTGTSRWEKRGIAAEVPTWDPAVCIQCNKCALVCPHAAIRAKVYPGAAPAGLAATAWKGPDFAGHRYTIAVAPDDCTGCSLCVQVCPAKDKANPRHKAIDMAPLAPPGEPAREALRAGWDAFLALPELDRAQVKRDVKGSQLLLPLFEYSGACAGCGETPYLKLLSQLAGDRLVVANATGCSSIFGGNLPTTPWTQDAHGRGPAWANSLFEDNAEFGLGLRLGVDAQARRARALLRALGGAVGDDLARALLAGADASPADEAAVAAQRERVAALRRALAAAPAAPGAAELARLADELVPRSVWLVGGDGWAYDIGFGGLDHVLALGKKVNILVLDTEVYSNTGGQQSKATPLGASAKFAAAGKATPKKDLGLMAMTYGHAYVARVAFGAKDAQTLKAFDEAERFPGPSLVIAYAHCIAHGYDLARGAEQQRLAVEVGAWPLYRFDPRRTAQGQAPLVLDSAAPRAALTKYTGAEARFQIAEKVDPARFERLVAAAQAEASRRWAIYEHLAGYAPAAPPGAAAPAEGRPA